MNTNADMSNTTRRRRTATTRRMKAAAPQAPQAAKPLEQPAPPAKFGKGSFRIPVIGDKPLTADVPARATLREQVELVLRRRPVSLTDVAIATNAPVEAVAAVVRQARLTGADLVNLGNERMPFWFWRPGDNGATPDLVEAVAGLISWRPLTLQELIDCTGARRNRLSGAIVRLHETDSGIRNLGNGQVARWFLPPKQN